MWYDYCLANVAETFTGIYKCFKTTSAKTVHHCLISSALSGGMNYLPLRASHSFIPMITRNLQMKRFSEVYLLLGIGGPKKNFVRV